MAKDGIFKDWDDFNLKSTNIGEFFIFANFAK